MVYLSGAEALSRAKEILCESRLYDHINALMTWDTKAYLPPSGRDYRVQASTYFEGKRSQLFNTEECRVIAGHLRDKAAVGCADDLEAAVCRRFLFNYDRCTAVPLDLQEEIARTHFENDAAWMEARRQKDYRIRKPALEKYFELKYRASQITDPNKHPLQVLMNFYDEDLDIDVCSRLLGELKNGVSQVMFKVLPNANAVDDSMLEIFRHRVQDIDELSHFACHLFGYTADTASYAKVVHGWSAMLSPRDSRVTVGRTDTGIDNFFTYVHEMGHSLYSLGSSQAVVDAGVWGGMKGSAHESQSRFYENIIARSPEFWEFFFPFVQARFPEMRDWTPEQFFLTVTKVQPQFKRTSADELTYSIHPVIRFELEKELFDRTLRFEDLSEAWNDKYEESLGIRPTNDLEGCLQDIHWTEDFGKFQSYPMGNIFDGQILQCVLRDIPDFYRQIAAGEFGAIHTWMHNHIHQYGFTYPTMALMERATGGEISSKYYLDYIRSKYYRIYGIAES